MYPAQAVHRDVATAVQVKVSLNGGGRVYTGLERSRDDLPALV